MAAHSPAALLACITATTGIAINEHGRARLTGGDVASAARVEAANGQQFFLKTLAASGAPLLAAEARGLQELRQSSAIRVPELIGCGATEDRAWLLLEWLELQARGDEWALGQSLARMHQINATEFGSHADNFIGPTRQINKSASSWEDFYASNRLRIQLSLAAQAGAPAELIAAGNTLLENIGHWFTRYQPVPSLLHGDLWSGNKGFLPGGEPVVFDPAVYYGDRETDLAMTRLFAGFNEDFYAGYHDVWPLDAGASARQPLYQLYHVLNHFNIFGGSYLEQAHGMIGRLLEQC